MPPFIAPTVVRPFIQTYNFKQTFTADSNGQIEFIFAADVTWSKQVSFMVTQPDAIKVAFTLNVAFRSLVANFGFLEGVVDQFPMDDGKIHTYPVIGTTFRAYADGIAPFTGIEAMGWFFAN